MCEVVTNSSCSDHWSSSTWRAARIASSWLFPPSLTISSWTLITNHHEFTIPWLDCRMYIPLVQVPSLSSAYSWMNPSGCVGERLYGASTLALLVVFEARLIFRISTPFFWTWDRKRTQYDAIARICSYSMNDGEREFTFGQVFCKPLVIRILSKNQHPSISLINWGMLPTSVLCRFM